MFQFTPVLRRATRRDEFWVYIQDVSIHARLATGDGAMLSIIDRFIYVSIHARLATGDD